MQTAEQPGSTNITPNSKPKPLPGQQNQVNPAGKGTTKPDPAKEKAAEEQRIKEEELQRQRQRDEDMKQLRKKLFGMVDEIMERQNKEDEMLKFESFQVETASRKVLAEMLSFYKQRDEKNDTDMQKIRDITDKCKNKVDAFESMLKKIQSNANDSEKLRMAIQKLQEKVESNADKNEKTFQSVRDEIKLQKAQFNSKLEVLNVYDQRFTKVEKEAQKLRELVHQFRDQHVAELNEEISKTSGLQNYFYAEIDQLTKKVETNNYFLQNAKETMTHLDAQVGVFKHQLQAAVEKLESENDRRVLTEDFKRATKALNEFLMHKFREQEDMKNSVRDCFTYLKLYSPLMNQMQINDQIHQLIKNQIQPFIDEEKILNFQSLKLESLLQNVLLEKGRAEKQQDQNIKTSIGGQLSEFMIKHALPRGEEQKSKKPQQQSAEEYMNDLIKQHLDDSRMRQNKQKLFSGGFQSSAEQLRNAVNLNLILEIIENIETKTEQQIKKSKKQAEEIMQKKRAEEQEQKIKRILEYSKQIDAQQTLEKKPLVLRRTHSEELKPKKDFFNLREQIALKKNHQLNRGNSQNSKGRRGLDMGQPASAMAQHNQPPLKIDYESYAPFMEIHFRTAQQNLKTYFKPLEQEQEEEFQKRLQQEEAQIEKQEIGNNGETVNYPQQTMLIQEQNTTKVNSPLPLQPLSDPKFSPPMPVFSPNTSQQQWAQFQQFLQYQTQMTGGPLQILQATQPVPGQAIQQQTPQQQQQLQQQQQPQQQQLQPGRLTKLQRKKLVAELKEEIQLVMASTIELKVSEQTSSILSQIRKIELDIANQSTRVSERFTKDLEEVRRGFREDFLTANEQLLEDITYLKKQRARDKSDFCSMVIESLNMSIFSEEQDVRDKQKMALIAGKDTKLLKLDLHASKIERRGEQSTDYESNDKVHNIPGVMGRSQSNDSPSEDQTQSPSPRVNQQNSKLPLLDLKPKIVKTSHPVNIDQSCLSCQVTGHDTQQILRMFKVACLSYQPSEVPYRSLTIPRLGLFRIRKQLIDKCVSLVQKTQLFKINALYPKRYFDDLVIEDSLMQNSLLGSNQNSHILLEQQPQYQKKFSFGIGTQKDFNQIMGTLNNTHSTSFNDEHVVLDNKYATVGESRNPPIKAIQNLTFTNRESNSRKFGDRNLSVQNSEARRQNSISTTRNLNNTTVIDYAMQQSNRQSIISGDSVAKPLNFDIEEIIKNPNSNIKKHSKAYQERLRANSNNNSIVASGVVYPTLNGNLEGKSRPKVSTNLGFQDLPRIKK